VYGVESANIRILYIMFYSYSLLFNYKKFEVQYTANSTIST
jgi:hypothetical protein